MSLPNQFDEAIRRRMERGMVDGFTKTVESESSRSMFLVVRMPTELNPPTDERETPQHGDVKRTRRLDTAGLDLAYLIDPDFVEDSDVSWLEGFQRLGPQARRQEVDQLRERCGMLSHNAGRINDPAAFHLLGLAAASAHQNGLSFFAFQRAARIAPERESSLLNLATAHMAVDELGAARAKFERLVSSGGSSMMVERARASLEQLDRHQAEFDRQIALSSVQRAALQEKIDHGTASPEDRIALARVLITLFNFHVISEPWTEIENLLRSLAANDHTESLELLTLAYKQSGDRQRLGETLRRLRRNSPDSPILQVFDHSFADEAATIAKQIDSVAMSLMESATDRKNADADEALETLRNLAATHSKNEMVLYLLALTELSRGDLETAKRHALELERRPNPSHVRHFNLAQFYAGVDRGECQRNLALALALASDAREIADVMALARHVGGDPDALAERFH